MNQANVTRRVSTSAKASIFAVLFAMAGHDTFAQVQFNVGSGQAYTSIQDAVNACPTGGCVLSLTDSTYPIKREIWIEAKNNITIQTSKSNQLAGIKSRLYYTGAAGSEFTAAGTAINPTDPNRPAGWKKWPKDAKNLPGGSTDTTNPFSTSGFQSNGYVVLFKSSNITIDGVIVDGKAPSYFVNKGIWCGSGQCYDVLFGNVGINIFESKNVTVRNSEIKNCFAGFYVQNRNTGGAFAAPNPNDLDVKSIIPYSRFGKMGNHLIEKNYVHNNWWGVYDEMEWDIGSTFRYNIFDANYNTRFATSTDSTSEANNMAGGMMYVKDVTIVPHKIYNNTINGSVLVLGHGGFKPGVQHYLYNNLLTGWYRKDPKLIPMYQDFRNLLQLYKNFIYNNTFEIGKDSAYQIQSMSQGQVVDATLKDPNNPAKTCAAGCWLTWDNPVKVYTGLQFGNALWNGWSVQTGGSYTGMFNAQPFQVANTQVVDGFGVSAAGRIANMQGLGAAGGAGGGNVQNQDNFWASRVSYLSSIPGAAKYLEPDWSTPLVDSTILNKGWLAAGTRDADGSITDRGAIPMSKGNVVSALTLADQTIVTLDKTNRTVSFQYCLDGLPGTWTDVKFEMSSYYNNIARATDKAWTPAPDWPNPIQLANTGTAPKVGTCGVFKASLVTPPVDSFARFDLVAVGSLNGTSVKSNIGVWIWRQTQYRLNAFFTKSSNKPDTITSAKVGDTVYMHVQGVRTDNGSTLSTLDFLAASPDKNMYLQTGKQILSGDTIGRNLAGGAAVYAVYFTQTGIASIALAGQVGQAPVPGSTNITIRPGLPYQAIWQVPADFQYLDHKSLDSLATTMPQGPSPISLQVVDKWGNNVDTIADVHLAAVKIDSKITNVGFASAAAGPFKDIDVPSDRNGKLALYNNVLGTEGQKYWGIANVIGKSVLDSGLMKVGKQQAQLYFSPSSKIDTFITVRQKVHLILSDDGTVVNATSPYANGVAILSSGKGTRFYASSSSTTPIDSIHLASGVVDLWVVSDVAIQSDTLQAYNPLLGAALPAQFAPVSFRMPPQPPTPRMLSASFLDGNCDGVADSVVVAFDPAGAVPTLDPAKVRIDAMKFSLPGGGTVDLDSTSLHLVSGGASIGISLPLSAQTKFARYSPAGQIQLFAALVRPPAADTVVSMGQIAVTDHVGPQVVPQALIWENPTGSPKDTLRIVFSEPIKFSGSGFPLLVKTGGTWSKPTATVASSWYGQSHDTLYLEITGNASQIKEHDVVRIDPASSLVDLSDTHAGDCANATDTLLAYVKPVPMVESHLLDANGDGAPDKLVVRFGAKLTKPAHFPDNLVAGGWCAACNNVTIPGASLSTTDSITFTAAITGWPKGATRGSGANGQGSLTFKNPMQTQQIDMVDSVGAIPTLAILRFGTGADTLAVTYSEGLSEVAASAYMEKLGGGPLTSLSKLSSNAAGDQWIFRVDQNANPTLNVGDSINLPVGGSKLVAANTGTRPTSVANPPRVVVQGGDRVPDSAIVLDVNGDGTADAVRLVYKKPLAGKPTFGFTWGGVTVSVDSLGYQAAAAGKSTFTIPVTGFPANTTAGPGQGTSTSFVSGSSLGALGFPLIDGVAPVLDSVYVAFGLAEGSPDTISMFTSEPLNSATTVFGLLAVNRRGVRLPFVARDPSAKVQVSGNQIVVVCDSCTDKAGASWGLPGEGDYARLEKGVLDGQLVAVGDSSRWVKVYVGPHPIRYNVDVYPKAVHEDDGTKDDAPIRKLPPVTAWILPPDTLLAFAPVGQESEGAAASGKLSGLDPEDYRTGLFGVRVRMNTSFDGQFLVYDNLGVFLGKTDLKISIDSLKQAGMLDANGRFTLVVALNGSNKSGSPLASGVYMVRMIGYSEQVVNGQKLRLMVQNKLFKVGNKRKLK